MLWLMRIFFFDEPVKNDTAKCNKWKKATGQGNDYAASCLLDYVYFKNHWINFVI